MTFPSQTHPAIPLMSFFHVDPIDPPPVDTAENQSADEPPAQDEEPEPEPAATNAQFWASGEGQTEAQVETPEQQEIPVEMQAAEAQAVGTLGPPSLPVSLAALAFRPEPQSAPRPKPKTGHSSQQAGSGSWQLVGRLIFGCVNRLVDGMPHWKNDMRGYHRMRLRGEGHRRYWREMAVRKQTHLSLCSELPLGAKRRTTIGTARKSII